MRIGIEVQRLYRKQKFGIEVAALQLIKNLQKNFKECEFIVYAKPDQDQHCLETSDNLKIHKVRGKLFLDFEHVTLPIAAKRDGIDILHCTGNTRPFISPVPVVQTVHDVIYMDPISTKDTFYQQFGNRYRRYMVPLLTPRSAAVITVSNYEKERILQKIKIDESKIRVIYNGIDENRFKVPDSFATLESVRVRYKLPKEFMLFLGNPAARKNSLRVIEAYCRYASKASEPMPIVTPGLSKKFVIEHLAVLNQTEKQKYFVSPGYIEDADLPHLYSMSTIFLYPSLSEGFGMPLIEAMACGSPVITSNTTCLPEISGDAALLVDPLSVSEIEQSINRLLSNDNLRITKIAQGIINARRFSWEKTAEQVFAVYEKTLLDKKKILHPAASVSYQIKPTLE